MFADSFLALAAFLSLQTFVPATTVGLPLQELPIARYAPPSEPVPVSRNPNNIGVEVTARAAVVLDVLSGQLLFGKDVETRYPIASMTKLMTAMVFLDTHPTLSDEVMLVEEDGSADGKQVFLSSERLSKRELLQALLIGSVNEAGNTLARVSLGREAFLKRMNAKARELGLRATFADPTGLSSLNQASSHDVALMLKAALRYEEIRTITSRPSVTVVGRVSKKPYLIKSTNQLLGTFLNKAPYHILGGKTGSLPEAGYCLVQDTRREQGGEIITVVMGSENHFARFDDAKILTAWAFEHFIWPNRQTAYMPSAGSKK